MKAWITAHKALNPGATLDAEGAIAPDSVRARKVRGPQAMHRALRKAVQAYARDPSERNAMTVAVIIAELRRQRAASR